VVTGQKKGNAKQVVFLVMLLVIVVLAAGVFFASRKSSVKIIGRGDRAPDFRLTALDGTPMSLAQFRGKVVMVHFWATWCPPCVEELPTLAVLNSALAGKDFIMLAVSVDEGGASGVRVFLQKNGLVLPVLLDPTHETASSYGTFKFPETYILDRNGIVRQKVIGAMDWRDPAAIRMVNELIGA